MAFMSKKFLLPRLLVVIPFALSVIVAVLASLCLFAGHTKGFMEDFAVARIDLTGLGTALADSASPEDFGLNKNKDKEEKDDEDKTWLEKQQDGLRNKVMDKVKPQLEDKADDVVNKLADKAAEEIGLSHWYSLHILDMCQGQFEPGPRSDERSFNVTWCSKLEPGFYLNITEVLDTELSLGPKKIDLEEDLDWPDNLESGVGTFNDGMIALFVTFVFGMGFGVFKVFSCAATFVWPEKRLLSIMNISFSILTAISLLISAIVTTLCYTEGVNSLNSKGGDYGIKVEGGDKFLIITWVSFSVSLVLFVFWLTKHCLERKKQKKQEKFQELKEEQLHENHY